ncbi:hypothetical protein C8K30_11420 [Promicromonospora sp. AC04]|uniref:hypothetical protein n=1 Tax=Promicromonospora sp. AC04 TaxID=2135723 RepID=UPI000D4FA286|nr:hypothetical protein [Promicromonospora sp. AC04]PUB21477.1 hypothetical protein C8K30_11420 [Promicromonospora sp. AC04]
MNQLKNGIRPRALRLLAGMLALGAAATVMAAAPASAATWEDDLVVRDSYVNFYTGELVEARCRVDVYPIAAKNLPGYVTVQGKVRCNHRMLAGGGLAFYVGSHGGDAAYVVADLRRIRTGSSPDKNATFSERIYISPADYRNVGGSGTWAVRGLDLGVSVRTLDNSRLFLWGYGNNTVETFRAY